METELTKAKDIIAKSEHIAMLLPERPDTDCFVAAEAIARACGTEGKHLAFLPAMSPDAARAPDACTRILNPKPLIREFVISIETALAPVAQLRYEKHEDRIDIILSPKSSPIRGDSLAFGEGKIQCDALITLGVPDIDALPPMASVDPAFFTETPIINIGNAAPHGSYGEVNLLSAPETSLSEIAYRLLGTIRAKPDPEEATLLLSGIMSHTHGFRSSVRQETHRTAAELMDMSADHDRASLIARAGEPFAVRQLVARASVRSKEAEGGRVLWSFLTSEDFEKTGRTPLDAPLVSQSLAQALAPHPVSVLLWQDPTVKRVHAALMAERGILESIVAREPGSFHSPSLVLAADFENFAAAEERITSLLREIL